MKKPRFPWCVLLLFFLCVFIKELTADAGDKDSGLDDIEAGVNACKPDPDFKDDVYGILVIQEAFTSLKEGSGGGIGACLVNEKTKEVVASGRNRQFSPYFRSDLHAEMDLLNRYEDWMRKKGGRLSKENPRECKDLVLISSVEPCPMCLTRMINAGIKKMYYSVPDEKGGMVSGIKSLPPFWRDLAEQCDYRQAHCSPGIQKIAKDMFDFSMRAWAKSKERPPESR